MSLHFPTPSPFWGPAEDCSSDVWSRVCNREPVASDEEGPRRPPPPPATPSLYHSDEETLCVMMYVCTCGSPTAKLNPSPALLNQESDSQELEEVSPVNVESKKRKGRRDKRRGKKSKKETGASTKTSPAEPALVPVPSDGDIASTFPPEYADVIKGLPSSLQPTSTRHGKHSYTVYLSCSYF